MNTDWIIITHFIRRHPADAAGILENLPIEEIAHFFREIASDVAVEIFKQFDRYTAVRCLELLNAEQSAAIVEKLPLHVVSIFLRRIKSDLREAILNLIPQETANPLRKMLSYPGNSAGALADPLVLTLPEDIKVKEALLRLQKRPEQAIYYLYIVNRNQALSGVINMRELMLAHPEEALSAVMHTEVSRLSAGLNFEAILNHPGWQEYHALPVVEEGIILLGAIRYETLRRIERESKKNRLPRHAIAASNALGELYQIGFSSLIRFATTPTRDRSGKN